MNQPVKPPGPLTREARMDYFMLMCEWIDDAELRKKVRVWEVVGFSPQTRDGLDWEVNYEVTRPGCLDRRRPR